MNIRTTLDPITLRDVTNPDDHPCLYEGDGENGVEIHFENEQTRPLYLDMQLEEQKVICGNDSDDYVAEG
ncbi:MAG: hypothetical protein K1562_07260 [Candidatus Thiodiazotropha sp. (ex. Lucinisca nassula)]|nr:hypothetical protein [Candidatus Thiodiazotropha sp. (ex. Lucinisca nassula)]